MKYVLLIVAALIVGGAAYVTLTQTHAAPSAPPAKTEADVPRASRPPSDGQAAKVHKIIATDGALTEVVYALGFGDSVVAADATARWPESVTLKPSIGYVRRISAEGILSLAPTLVLNNADAGPPEIIEQLRSAGLNITTFPARRWRARFP